MAQPDCACRSGAGPSSRPSSRRCAHLAASRSTRVSSATRRSSSTSLSFTASWVATTNPALFTNVSLCPAQSYGSSHAKDVRQSRLPQSWSQVSHESRSSAHASACVRVTSAGTSIMAAMILASCTPLSHSSPASRCCSARSRPSSLPRFTGERAYFGHGHAERADRADAVTAHSLHVRRIGADAGVRPGASQRAPRHARRLPSQALPFAGAIDWRQRASTATGTPSR